MSMQKAFLVLFVFMAFSCSKETAGDTIIEAENVVTLELELLDIVNDYRETLGQNALAHNNIAYEQANIHNDYMISKGDISHDNFSSRASKIHSELNIEIVAENVAKDFTNANDAFKGWLKFFNNREYQY